MLLQDTGLHLTPYGLWKYCKEKLECGTDVQPKNPNVFKATPSMEEKGGYR